MAKRVSKKLLLGLGSTLTFGTIGVVGGFGIKSIVDISLNNQIEQFSVKSVTEDVFSNAPDYNVATKDMFIDPSNLKRFHFGNTLIGQTVTPYGWLGVFDDPYKSGAVSSTRIALTGWNGEILWVNEPTSYGSDDKRNYNVYDMEYDFKNDLIFVLRTWSSNGFLNDTNEGLPSIRLDILDAKTGKAYEGSAITWIKEAPGDDLGSKLREWQKKALKALKENKYINWGNPSNRDQSKNLYQLDIASGPQQQNFLVTWMPDFMRLTKSFGTTSASSITLKDFVKLWPEVSVSWFMLPDNIKQNKPAEISRYFDLSRSDEIDLEKNGNIRIKIGGTFQPADQYYLIANPFFTVGSDDGKDGPVKPFYIMHILFASKTGEVYHKTIGWEENISNSDAKGIAYKKSKYDRLQRIDWKEDNNFIDGTGLLVEAAKSSSDSPSWTKRDKYTSPDVIRANTRINKNMFDNNSVVFAYPYGAATFLDKRYSMFNVAQMYVEPLTGFFYGAKDVNDANEDIKIKKIARQFYFGRDIEQNNKEIAHYPGAKGKNNINQTYHRLISVSPFDNTFIYSEKPNIKHNFFDPGSNNDESKWAGFFVGKVFRNTNDVVRPFFIWNAPTSEGGSASSLIEPTMTSFEKIYEDGFTFDLRSFQTSGNNIGLNLYFNQNGNPNGTNNPNGLKSRKIGMLPDIFKKIDNEGLSGADLWIGNKKLAIQQQLKNPSQFYGFTGAKIESSSFSIINHSRADLEKWYPRTLFNNSNPANFLARDFSLNNPSSETTRAVPSSFDSRSTGNDFTNTSDSKKSVDMVSGWENNPNNYNRLVVKRPEIKIRNESIPSKLPIKTTYNFSNNSFIDANIWTKSLANNYKSRLVFETQQDLSAASYQIFSSWKEQIRMDKIATTTNNFSASENPNFKNDLSWYDKRKPNANSNPFGNVNNNLDINGKKPLRMLLQISKPDGATPSWFKKINEDLFKKYPLAKDAVKGETTFETILQRFVEEKTRKIDLTESSSAAIGLGNLKIDAFMDVNPSAINSGKFTIYKLGGNKRMIVQNSAGLRIIYEDNYNQQWHEIYNQNQTIYEQFNRGGFGDAVRADVQTSWVPNKIPSSSTKLKVSVNAQHFQDNLVRKSPNDRKIFTFDYSNDRKNLIITPTDSSWLRERLLNFQRLINMTPRFEYQTEQDPTWKNLTTLSDSKMKNIWSDANATNFSLPSSSINNINKLRLKLIPNDVINANDPNSFVQLIGYTETNGIFISDPQEIGIQRVDVDPSWFDNLFLDNNSHSLATLTSYDFLNFENEVFKKSTAIQNKPGLRDKVKLKYRWNNESQLYDNSGIANLIQQRLNNFNSTDQGVFALWNGTTGIKIQAIFSTDDSNISFTVNNNLNPNESQLTGYVKSNIKNEINLGSYINELTSSIINATAGNSVGEFLGSTIQFPQKTGAIGSSQFAGKTYQEIEKILKNVDISIQYKKWENGVWSSWIKDLNQVNKYNPINPQIKIGFKINSLSNIWNIKLLNNGQEITENTEYTLNLNLPKLVKLPSDLEINELIKKFNQQNIFSENTYKLEIDNTKLELGKKIVADALKSASSSNGSGYEGLEDYLILKFKLGNSNWLEASSLKKWLSEQMSDQNSNELKMKIELMENKNFILDSMLSSKEFDLLQDNNLIIKKYIHGTELEEQLNQITVSGTSNLITYSYPNEVEKVIKNNKNGLKLQYTYNDKLPVTLKIASKDANTNWTDVTNNSLPTTGIPNSIKKIYVRIFVTNPDLYVYGPEINGSKNKGMIDLTNLRDQINVNSVWFDFPFPLNQELNLNDLSVEKINDYEKQVFQNANTLTEEQKNKLSIKYYFGNNTTNPMDKNGLFNALNNYKNATTFDILQLWNNHQGEKINATFEKKESNGNYDLIWVSGSNQKQLLDTSKIVTTVELESVVKWLETVKVLVNKNGNNIDSLEFPSVNAQGLFNKKEWSKTEQVLESLGIRVQYQEMTSITDSSVWHESIENIKSYDSRSQFKIRFLLQKENGKNIIVKIRNGENLSCSNGVDAISSDIIVNLNVPKVIKIDDQALANFRDSNPFSGNTKKINVDKIKIEELIRDIKNSKLNIQVPGIEKAPLNVGFRFGNSGDFKLLDQWKKDLEDMNTDQSTNQIQIKFIIDSSNSNEWSVEVPVGTDGAYTVLPANNSTVPIYVHDQEISENIKMGTTVSGTNDALVINFPKNNDFIVDDNNEIKGRKGLGLKLQFSLDANHDVNDDSKWDNKRPINVPPGTNKFFVRIVPINSTYVYEKKVEGQYTKIQINFNVVQKIIVDKKWINELKLGENNIEINSLDINLINKWIEKIQEKVKKLNNITDEIAKKVSIKFTFKGESNLTPESLLSKINFERNNFNSPDLGIVKLWNGNDGDKIRAEFTTTDNLVLIQDNQGNNSNLFDDILTSNIYTKIDLRNYVKVLENSFTRVIRNNSLPQGQLESFIPPDMEAGTTQFSGKTYEQIATRLSAVGIKVLFRDFNTGRWVEKQSLKTYNTQTALLPLSFSNDMGTNVVLEVSDNLNIIKPGDNNQSNPINLKLQVPKQFFINGDKVNNYRNNHGISGDTKYIKLDDSKLNNLLSELKIDNNIDANNPLGLKVLFSLNLETPFLEFTELQKTLSLKDVDQVSNKILIKFKLDDSERDKWFIQNENEEYVILNEGNSVLKLFINDWNIFTDLKNTKFNGTNENLQWNFQSGIQVNETTGELRKIIGSATHGVGLKLAYSFDNQDWTNEQPKKYQPTQKQVFIKIELQDKDKYVYDNVDQVITLALNLPVNIHLKNEWLNQQLFTEQAKSIDDFIKDANVIFTKYEEKVYKLAEQNGIDSSLHSKFAIKYNFDNNQNLSKDELIQKLASYKTDKSTTNTFGILQLWNKNNGIKIEANFVDADTTDNFEIKQDSQTPFQLDTSKVITTIDFSKVVAWLTAAAMKVPIDEGNIPNSIQKIKIPNTGNLNDDYFNNRNWDNIENALATFGIEIEYKPDGVTGANWSTLANVNAYDPATGQIQFRFKFKNNQYTNVKLLINGQQLDGANPTTSNEYKFKLDVKLNVFVDPFKIETFIQQANIYGDTKNIQINREAEKQLIDAIIQENATNNQEFNNVNLKVEYYLGSEQDRNIVWRDWDSFQKDLAAQTKDQKSNRVIFRLAIDDSQSDKFSVSSSTHVLHNNNLNVELWTVKFFINKANLENKASQISVSGTSSIIKWNYNSFNLANLDIVPQTDGLNKIFIKNEHGQRMLQLYFSTKENIDYNEQTSDNLNDITTKWVSLEPKQFLDQWQVSKLYVKLVPVAGYVYEAQDDKTARAHQISLDNLKLEIKVNPEKLKASLDLSANKKYLHEITVENIKQFVQKAIDTVQINKDKVDVNFRFNNKTLTTENLFTEIKTLLGNTNGGSPKNIVQLWNGFSGQKIEAKFTLKDSAKGQYTLIDSENQQTGDAERFVIVTTSHIKTLINLREIINGLEKLKIEVSLPSQSKYDLTPLEKLIMPAIPNGNNSELQGLTWEKFEERLKTFGVTIEARPKVKPGTVEQPWTSITSVKKYDSNLLSLELRFKINSSNGQNIVLSVKADADADSTTTDGNLPTFEMNLKAPAKVQVSEQLITTFIQQGIFSGDTKYLKIDSKTPETTLIEAIIKENTDNNPDIYQELNGRLEIQYYLGRDGSQANINWRSADELKKFLSEQTQDQITNQIWFRFNIKNTGNTNEQIFQIDQNPRILNQEQIDATAKIKIYINETGFTNEIKKLRAIGSTDNYDVDGLSAWKAKVPKGLEVGYSKEDNPDEATESQWTKQLPNQLTSNKKLWVRFKVEDGYVYQDAKTDNPKYGTKQAIDTTGIKVILKVETEWLKKIIVTGNTINAVLNEEKVLEEIRNSGILPNGQTDLIELQYNIIGTTKWWSKVDFEQELARLKGRKDGKNFILKRDDLQVRFNIKGSTTKADGDYGLNIDGENINSTNRDRYNIKLVEKNQRNDDFKGLINLEHLKDFTINNFKIIGSTTEPKLIITKRQELDQLFMPYASDNLFDIQFSTTKKSDGNWDWNSGNSILKNGKLIDENGLITQGVTIGAEKHFAIRFISKDRDAYEVYSQNTVQPNGHILDISDNVKITVEIINPFTIKNKTLAIWTREINGGKNTGKYFQGEGGFKIGVANINTFIVEDNGQQSAQDFLAKTSDLTDPEREALELVFHVFDQNPTEQEMDRVKRAINDYGDSTWQSFETIKESSSDWSKNLKLKVGDSVAVALRIKESYANQENPFILKGDDYSMILPVMKDSSGATVKPGRLSGYKVKTDLIDIQKDNVIVANMISSQLPPLDGWTELQRVNLKPDQSDHYLGVDLKVQVYTEFHENPDGKILLSGNNTKLVKRTTSDEDTNVEDKGNYKDQSNQDIIDKDNKPVKIYKDKRTNRLSEPKKNNSGPTKSKMMTNLGGGSFKFDPDTNSYERGRLSLFRNQDVDLLVVANKGEGTEELPDFYLDKEDKTISLREQISPQIKFPVENEKKISYAWNYEQFGPDQIEYKSTNNNPNPEDGNAQINTIYKLVKKEGTSSDIEEITGNSIEEAVRNVEQKLKDDFGGQLRFETVYQTNKGNQTILQNSNIYNFKNLSNKDRIVLKIVAVEEDLFYVSEDQPLVINVNGLTEKAPNKNKLQYLRVKQGGLIDGQGSFKVLVSNPEKDDEDDQSILNGWKFMIRVWDKEKDENGNWQIKIPWSDDPAQIKGLANGDKVEWKLVSADGNPVKDAYYNTIALNHVLKPDGNIDYKFGEVSYPNGQSSYNVVNDGIGSYPQNDNQYPEDSGFIISGLKPTFQVFKINQETFESIIKELNPFYVGLNYQGAINFDSKYLEDNYWVNTKGEIYLKDQSPIKLTNEIEELPEISIKEFIDNITFFTQDPVLFPYQNGFKFSGNDININNNLANGNHIWAQFNMISFNNDKENSKVNLDGNISSITLQLADVSGLKNTTDPMSPLWYVLMALAGIVTLGTTSIIAYFVARHKKLKGKN